MDRKNNLSTQLILDKLNNKRKDCEARLKSLRTLIYQPSNRVLTILSKDDFYTESTLRDNHFAEAKTLEELIEKVNLAIKRFKNGQLGFCVKCGKRIEMKRLELMPYSDVCSTCAKNA